MLKTEQLDKLEQLSKALGVRSVLQVAYTEGYADAYRLAFQHKSDRKIVNFLNDAPNRVQHIRFVHQLEEEFRNYQEPLADMGENCALCDAAKSAALADMEHAGISESHAIWDSEEHSDDNEFLES